MAHGTGQWMIGVDVGGTKIAAAAVDVASGSLAHRREIPTNQERGAAAVLAGIASLVNGVATDAGRTGHDTSAVGIGVPEIVDPVGHVSTSHLLDWNALPLGDLLKSVGPVRFSSDVRAAALAEATLGAGRSHRQVLYVSAGTGISSTFVQDGIPLAGARGAAVVLSSASIAVPCRTDGEWHEFVLEEYASGPAIARRFRALSGHGGVDARAVMLAAEAGDGAAIEIVASAARTLGSAIGWLVNVLDPEVVVIGGGLGLAGGLYWDRLVHATRAHMWYAAARDVPMTPAALGADAGIVGAALTAYRDGSEFNPSTHAREMIYKP